jgi:hypothetical protein
MNNENTNYVPTVLYVPIVPQIGGRVYDFIGWGVLEFVFLNIELGTVVFQINILANSLNN